MNCLDLGRPYHRMEGHVCQDCGYDARADLHTVDLSYAEIEFIRQLASARHVETQQFIRCAPASAEQLINSAREDDALACALVVKMDRMRG